MATGSFTVQATVSGGPSGSEVYNSGSTITAAVPSVQTVALNSGANTITLPTGTTFFIVIPPNAVVPQPNPAYGGVLTLKGVSGDTGLVIDNKIPTGPVAASTSTSFVINASVTCSVTVWSA